MSEVRVEWKFASAKIATVCIWGCVFYLARRKGLNFSHTR